VRPTAPFSTLAEAAHILPSPKEAKERISHDNVDPQHASYEYGDAGVQCVNMVSTGVLRHRKHHGLETHVHFQRLRGRILVLIVG